MIREFLLPRWRLARPAFHARVARLKFAGPNHSIEKGAFLNGQIFGHVQCVTPFPFEKQYWRDSVSTQSPIYVPDHTTHATQKQV